ncbi:hypothetical protein F3C99_11400 [Vitellibacter sp. q18]|nr:hypothetical protein [Aequorivita lutea]
MIISYENDDIRNCCLLLRSSSLNSNFTTDEIKEIRAIVADLRAAPRLIDSPIKYNIDKELWIINIEYERFKIVGKIISTYETPTDDQIERIKIIQIINISLQIEFSNKHNFK